MMGTGNSRICIHRQQGMKKKRLNWSLRQYNKERPEKIRIISNETLIYWFFSLGK